ncbi:MAG: hypothetical protein KJT03_09250 [Verrucomicrobiae bacterium]|nr:hypothetical protein [Verrucomicrobiae bacterium]
MNAEEDKQVEILLNPASSASQQKAALTWIRNYLEEGDILNLPPSRQSLNALQSYGSSGQGEAALKQKAKKLLKEYARG